MQYCAINVDSTIIYLSLISLAFEVKYLNRSIFTGGKKPLVLLLELESYGIPIEAIKCSFLIKIPQVINLDVTKG
jgi:hypothetical protein